jgi:Zn-dependent protease with chaperone function
MWVQRLEVLANQQPDLYRQRVAWLAALGYGFLIFVIVILLGLFGGCLWFVAATGNIWIAMTKGVIGFPLAARLAIESFIILASLLNTFNPLSGIALNRDQAPQLFVLLDELCRRLQVAMIDHIILDRDLNAGVFQAFNLRQPENYLVLGLPLMQALSPEQFQATIAHELGHLSDNHSHFAGYIYRTRTAWPFIAHYLSERGTFHILLLIKIFFDWYVPFFSF